LEAIIFSKRSNISSEADVAVAEVAREFRCIMYLLNDVGAEVYLPIVGKPNERVCVSCYFIFVIFLAS
jgi:hypothetical protein